MSTNHLDPCSMPEPEKEPILDPIPGLCPDPTEAPSLHQVSGRPDMGWNDTPKFQNMGIGKAWNRDPIQAGKLRNDPLNPDRTVIYRYSKAIRGCDEAVRELFSDIEIEDDNGKFFQVPILLSPVEKAVAVMVQDNVRKDNSNVVDRIRLPMLALVQSGMQFDPERYTYHKAIDYMREYGPEHLKPGFTQKEKYARDTVFGVSRGVPYNISYVLHLWVKYEEDANQIIEQILLKMTPKAYIRINGVGWEVPVVLDGVADNRELEPGDKNLRVLKYEFSMTAQTYIPQPIVRKKAVLKTRTEILDGLTDAEATGVLGRIEEAVKELE